MFYYEVGRFLDQQIRKINPNYDRQSLNTDLANKAILGLKDFPDSVKPHNLAMETFHKGGDDRIVLDNLRVAFEQIMRKKLNNTKSLEKQRNDLGLYLKRCGNSKEITDMFDKLVNGYTDYQNEYVKHGVGLRRDEVELLVNLTLAFMNFIMNK